jgi:hypothetical protein
VSTTQLWNPARDVFRNVETGQESGLSTTKRRDVDAHIRLAHRIDQDTDDVLATLPLVRENTALVDRLFDQLVDLLVEALFLDLRNELAEGRLDREGYTEALTALAADCRRAGLLPLPSRF